MSANFWRLSGEPTVGRCAKRVIVSLVVLGLSAASAAPIAAQEYPLIDRFTLSLAGSNIGLSTEIRLDSRELGLGTTINFEDDLGLDSSKIIPALSFQARLGRRHVIDGFWTKADRNSTSQALDEIRFGDIVIPGGSQVALAYDQESFSLGYSYYFLLRDRWGLGARIGARYLSLTTILTVRTLDLEEKGDTAYPLPFLGFSFRYGITQNNRWRLISNFGWLSVDIGDADGSQYLLNATVEHLTWKHFGFGLGFNLTTVDVTIDDGEDFIGTADLSTTSVGIFGRARW
jgi:hypothetical protein